jgi:hypothetical protein
MHGGCGVHALTLGSVGTRVRTLGDVFILRSTPP